jgi:hypothetical protein
VYERARTAAARALSVGETVPEAHTSAAFVQFVFDWDWPAAEANCRKAVALDPSYGQGYLSSNRISGSHTSSSGRRISNLAAMHRHTTPWRRPRGCREVTRSLFRLRATPFATLGRRSEAREVVESLERRSQQHYVPPYALALVHAGLNDREGMYECLDRAFSARDVHLIYLPVDPKWDAFRNDGRFIELLQRGRFLERRAARRDAAMTD